MDNNLQFGTELYTAERLFHVLLRYRFRHTQHHPPSPQWQQELWTVLPRGGPESKNPPVLSLASSLNLLKDMGIWQLLSWFRITEHMIFWFSQPPELDKKGNLSTCFISAVINPEEPKGRRFVVFPFQIMQVLCKIKRPCRNSLLKEEYWESRTGPRQQMLDLFVSFYQTPGSLPLFIYLMHLDKNKGTLMLPFFFFFLVIV